jgi:UDP-N-acetylglucosamine--dolichyl-phosphate N-acetylglucosaminephosphotransferase
LFLLLGPISSKYVYLIIQQQINSPQQQYSTYLVFNLFLSILLAYLTAIIIPQAGEKLIHKLSGIDLGKWPRQPAIPQGLGLISGTSFLVILICTQAFISSTTTSSSTSSSSNETDKNNVSAENLINKFDTLMLSVCFSILLGLADDVMDIRWAHKVGMGIIMGLPLAIQYDGPTSILIPQPFRILIDENSPLHSMLKLFEIYPSPTGAVLELFKFYLVYVICLSIFCTNAINIYAGINGLEVGQSIVAACGIVWMNLSELSMSSSSTSSTTTSTNKNNDNHIFSLLVMIPFILTSLSLLKHNWYPARVFIGDTYPYYAGMTFAATAILGHYSRTLLLLLIPQLLNWLYSLPQLFGYVPCPRHRLPRVNQQTLLLEPSTVAERSEQPNMTLICLALRICGPMSERSLTITLLIFQAICTIIGLMIRGVFL